MVVLAVQPRMRLQCSVPVEGHSGGMHAVLLLPCNRPCIQYRASSAQRAGRASLEKQCSSTWTESIAPQESLDSDGLSHSGCGSSVVNGRFAVPSSNPFKVPRQHVRREAQRPSYHERACSRLIADIATNCSSSFGSRQDLQQLQDLRPPLGTYQPGG